jgi:FAD/FMN-containing dehydrogenase
LGIVTEATLKLTRLPGESDVFFFALGGVPDVLSLFLIARQEAFTINAFEVLGDNCLQAVLHHRKLKPPFSSPAPYYVLMEVERPQSEAGREKLESWLGSLFENGNVLDGVLAQSSQEKRDLWDLREGVSESIMAQSLVHKHDIALPISRLSAFIAELLAKFQSTYHGYEVFLFGHIGDGNMHLNIRKPEALEKAAFLKECEAIDQALFPLVQKHLGSVSAEHGIGLLKKRALPYSRTPEELALFKTVKRAMDPEGLLNPGKIFD